MKVTSSVAACFLALIVLLAAGCSPGAAARPAAKASPTLAGQASTARGTPAAASPSNAPPAPAAPLQLPPQAPASVDLTFTGAVVGRVQGSDALGTCGRLAGGYSAQLQVTVSGEALIVGMQIFNYHGPGQYSIPPERVSVHSPGVGAGSRFLPAMKGKLDVDPGEASGRIEAALGDQGGSANLRGTWICTARPPA